jgi:hypothetical protein
MDAVFSWVETTALSTFIRESASLWVFPFILILHTWGLAFLVGANVAIDARALGVALAVPFWSLDRYYRVMWVGFWINAVSGVLLLIAYPTKALTNPVFYVKLLMIAAALVLAGRIRLFMQPGSGSAGAGRTVPASLAIASLACWAIAIFAGRFLAYTCTRLMVEYPC